MYHLTKHHPMKMYGGVDAFLTSALDGSEWSASHPGKFTPRNRTTGTLNKKLGGPQGW